MWHPTDGRRKREAEQQIVEVQLVWNYYNGLLEFVAEVQGEGDHFYNVIYGICRDPEPQSDNRTYFLYSVSNGQIQKIGYVKEDQIRYRPGLDNT